MQPWKDSSVSGRPQPSSESVGTIRTRFPPTLTSQWCSETKKVAVADDALMMMEDDNADGRASFSLFVVDRIGPTFETKERQMMEPQHVNHKSAVWLLHPHGSIKNQPQRQ